MKFTPIAATMVRKGFRPAPKIADKDACLRRAAEMQARGQLEEAAREYRLALARFPRFALAYNNLGTVLLAQGKFVEATLNYEKASAIEPFDARILVNTALSWLLRNRLDKAIPHYRTAVELFEQAEQPNDPGRVAAEMSLAEALLTQGQFEEGFRRFECRHRLPALAPLYTGIQRPMWEGENLEGTHILILAEQGVGDTLQFIRYLPLVRERAARTTIVVPTLLQSVVREIPGIEVVSGGSICLSYDKYCPLMSLPRCFGTTLETVPSTVPYLTVPSTERGRAAALSWSGEKLRVGIVWAGNPAHPKDQTRSLPFREMERLLPLKEVQFFSFQLGREEERRLVGQYGVSDPGLEPANFAYTAAVLEHMDLLISVDTALAHLAGGLGLPVWLLLPFAPDWRWLLSRDDSPWYPRTKLFRQKEPGSWSGVIAEVLSCLTKMAA